jgi:hypothetical protein
MIEIRYSASSPSGIRSTADDPLMLPAGHLRVWMRDGDDTRDAADVLDDGDFVAPGQYEAVADQVVTVIVTDGATGFQVEDQVRFTTVRFEIEARNLEGNFVPVGHFVASTLSSGAPANLNQAWNTYRVNIYDPRQTGLTRSPTSATVTGRPSSTRSPRHRPHRRACRLSKSRATRWRWIIIHNSDQSTFKR